MQKLLRVREPQARNYKLPAFAWSSAMEIQRKIPPLFPENIAP